MAASTMVRGGAGDGGLEPETGFSWGCFVQWTELPYGGVGTGSKLLEVLRVGSKLAPFALSVNFPPSFQYQQLCPRGKRCWSERAGSGPQHGFGHSLW